MVSQNVKFGVTSVTVVAGVWGLVTSLPFYLGSLKDLGVRRFRNGDVEIGAFYSPIKFLEYNDRGRYESISIERYTFSPALNSISLLDFNDDNHVDSILRHEDGVDLDRKITGTEEIFQRADKAWSEYTAYLKVDEVLAQEPEPKDLPKISF